jgi:hypothetical protein
MILEQNPHFSLRFPEDESFEYKPMFGCHQLQVPSGALEGLF